LAEDASRADEAPRGGWYRAREAAGRSGRARRTSADTVRLPRARPATARLRPRARTGRARAAAETARSGRARAAAETARLPRATAPRSGVSARLARAVSERLPAPLRPLVPDAWRVARPFLAVTATSTPLALLAAVLVLGWGQVTAERSPVGPVGRAPRATVAAALRSGPPAPGDAPAASAAPNDGPERRPARFALEALGAGRERGEVELLRRAARDRLAADHEPAPAARRPVREADALRLGGVALGPGVGSGRRGATARLPLHLRALAPGDWTRLELELALPAGLEAVAVEPGPGAEESGVALASDAVAGGVRVSVRRDPGCDPVPDGHLATLVLRAPLGAPRALELAATALRRDGVAAPAVPPAGRLLLE